MIRIFLQYEKNHSKEIALVGRADIVLATSKNLAERYLPKYFGIEHENIRYWPNTADLELWNHESMANHAFSNDKYIAGMAGNLNDRSDMQLLDSITDVASVYYEICRKITDEIRASSLFTKIFQKPNVKHLGFISI
ncbi:MAG: hypothetical protein U5K72_14565 [Balneolaceae bacterium]|nr:hypothetical protein [Balneolaceae bacterium]